MSLNCTAALTRTTVLRELMDRIGISSPERPQIVGAQNLSTSAQDLFHIIVFGGKACSEKSGGIYEMSFARAANS